MTNKFSSSLRRVLAAVLLLSIASSGRRFLGQTSVVKPTHLQCASLVDPVGLDEQHPRLSWQMQDGRQGAKQTAYRITVFSHDPAHSSAPADVWDSGEIASDVSIGVPYTGPALVPSRLYFWRVQLRDGEGRLSAPSDTAHWETGLLAQSNWHAQWIGSESQELHAVRESGAVWITNSSEAKLPARDTQHDFRLSFSLQKPVAYAVLYTTGEDTAGAWLNGEAVLAAKPFVPWQQMPWGTYERVNVTGKLRTGGNVLAIGVTRYRTSHDTEAAAQTMMSAALYVRFQDGSVKLFTSAADGWKAALDMAGAWWTPAFDDAAWPAAKRVVPPAGPFGTLTGGRPWPTGPVVALRKEFPVERPLVSARLYATALGAYKVHLNGSVVGDQVLAPGWMDFRDHVAYQVYDVTGLLHPGQNAIGAFLAAGWYSTPLAWFRQGNNYGSTQPALKAQLRLQYADGSVVWVATDGSWQAGASPITFAELYDGETRDARLEQPRWDRADFKAAGWRHADLVTPDHEPQLESQFFQPIRQERVMTARAITEPKPGVFVFDFGQNMAALPHLSLQGVAGTDVQLRFAEALNSDGTVYVENLRTAKATDHFILSGSGTESFEPLFTYHGFRYAEITGIRSRPTLETLRAVVVHTDAPFTSRFSTGEPMIDQLWSNVLWGQRSNIMGTPTDCPQRDERLGWSADAQVFWRAASYNMDLSAFSRKYAADLRGTQKNTPMYGIFAPGVDASSPGFAAAWSDAGVIIPWTAWLQSGNVGIIDENWQGMQRYLDAIERANPNGLWQHDFGIPFGDWLTPTVTTPEDIVATAFWAYDVSLMRQMALATHRAADAERYAALFGRIKDAFVKAYTGAGGFVGAVDLYPSIPPPSARSVASQRKEGQVVETQTAYVLALHMHLLPEDQRPAAADRLVSLIRENHGRLGTGFLGTPYLLAVLSDTGHSDIAYRLLLSREYPSWGYLIDHGATTTWERWNGDETRSDPSMNSYNHYAYGAVAEWLYRYAAGIDTLPEGAGFHRIYLHPNFDPRLGHLSLDYASESGLIHSDWSVTGQTVAWNVTVPANATALFRPASTNATDFSLDGVGLSAAPALQAGPERGEFVLPAGSYHMTALLRASALASGEGRLTQGREAQVHAAAP